MSSKFLHRTWGTRFDSLPPTSPPPASPNSSTNATDIVQPSLDHVKKPRMPHNASIFVGSLPVNVDHYELARLLEAHLADFSPVKSVKVIRDTKGGVCAFVQCEDADAATRLLHSVHSKAPVPFLGRLLRFEPARAYRSLLISYRTPTEPIIVDGKPTGETVELTFPSAMRINKHRSPKFPYIAYGEEAIIRQAGQNSFAGHIFYKEPVICDAATLKELCSFFGPLEHFELYKGNDDDGNTSPSPHDAPRKPNMEQGCFDVKWAHRDDCINALMALRRVPHFTATWAHASPEREQCQADNNGPPYPLYPQVRPNSISTSGHSRTPSSSVNDVAPQDVAKDWNSTPQRPQISTNVGSTKLGAWREADFPPLVDSKPELKFESKSSGVWVEKQPSVEAEAEAEKEKTEENFVYEPTSESQSCGTDSLDGTLDNFPSLKSDFGRCSVSISENSLDVGQELELHHTPALARSPVTPKTPGSVFPPTPTSFHGEGPGLFSKDVDVDEFSYTEEGIPVDERDFDRSTIFVGGLEMHGPGAWDEAKVYEFFNGRYGGVESVNLIRPSSKAAFAFVKFNNIEVPERAVRELHNRIFEGRALRVQLRVCNHRGAFRGRGRGRYPSFHHGHHRRQSVQTESKIDKSVDASFVDPLPTEELTLDAPVEADLRPAEPARTPATETTPAERISMPEVESSSQVYREWYELGECVNQSPVSTTPPSGAPFATEVGPGIPPLHVPAFYPPAPWVHQYPPPPHMQYPVGYYPPVYPPVALNGLPRYPGSSGSDASNPTSVQTLPWNGINYGYIPYPGYHPRPAEQQQPQEQGPPVVPTGFFQNEAGTLIPVYPRAIIDQYMTNNSNHRSSPPIGIPVTVPATVPSPMPIPPGPQAWSQCIPTPFGPNQIFNRGLPPSPMQAQSSGWLQPMNFQATRPPSLHPSGMQILGPHSFREAFHSGSGSGNGKRQGRREPSHGGRGRNGTHRGRGSHVSVGSPHGDGYAHRENGQAIGDWTRWPEAH